MPFLNKEYVYLLKEYENDKPTGLVKIGRTARSVQGRIDNLKTGNSRKLKMQYVIETEIGKSVEKEKEWHDSCLPHKSKHGGGEEWFEDSNLLIERAFKSESCIKNNEFQNYKEKFDDFSLGKFKSTFEFVEQQIISHIYEKHICVFAPPKSGKRIMVQSVALLMPYAHHFFVTSLDRTDIKPQIAEFEKFKIVAKVLTNSDSNNKKEIDNIKKEIDTISSNGGEVVIHFDECDYGSQKSGKAYEFLKATFNSNNVHLIVYSATPEEAIWSDTNYHIAFFKPSPSYKGPSSFENNTFDAEPFFDINSGENIELSSQAEQILNDWMNSDKKYIVLRLNYKLSNKKSAFDFAKNNDNLADIVNSYVRPTEVQFEWIDQTYPFNWFFTKDGKTGSWDNCKKKTIFIINGTCSRSTEVGFHPDIFAWHDYRKGGKKASTTYGTYAQAIGRVFHYSSDYINPERINFFGNKDTKIQVYAEKELMSVMAKIYASFSKKEMEEIWSKYLDNTNSTVRKLGSRVKHKNVGINNIDATLHVFSDYNQAKLKFDDIKEKDLKKDNGILDARGTSGLNTLSHWKSNSLSGVFKSLEERKMINTHDILWHIDGAPGNVNFNEIYSNFIKKFPQYKNKYLVLEPVYNNKISTLLGNNTIHNEL